MINARAVAMQGVDVGFNPLTLVTAGLIGVEIDRAFEVVISMPIQTVARVRAPIETREHGLTLTVFNEVRLAL